MVLIGSTSTKNHVIFSMEPLQLLTLLLSHWAILRHEPCTAPYLSCGKTIIEHTSLLLVRIDPPWAILVEKRLTIPLAELLTLHRSIPCTVLTTSASLKSAMKLANSVSRETGSREAAIVTSTIESAMKPTVLTTAVVAGTRCTTRIHRASSHDRGVCTIANEKRC